MNKFKPGDKVVPINKSVGCTFTSADLWNQVKHFENAYLYVQLVPVDRGQDQRNHYLVGMSMERTAPLESYMESDLIPYGEEYIPKYKIGDKVVPLTKTYGCALVHSVQWALAKTINQNFLYVRGVPNMTTRRHYLLSSLMDEHRATEHYMESDLIPFVGAPKLGDLVKVWDVPSVSHIRQFVCELPNGGCLSVARESANLFSNVEAFDVLKWKHYEVVPPKPTSISVKLNDNHTAVVTKDSVTVGCQVIPASAVIEAYDALHKLQNENQ